MKKTLLLSLLLLSACASQPLVFDKPNIDDATFEQDRAACSFEVRKLFIYNPRPTLTRALMIDCMASKGYRLVPQEEVEYLLEEKAKRQKEDKI